MDLEPPSVINVARDFYDWKAIYRKAKHYDSIQEAVDMAIVRVDLSSFALTMLWQDGDTIILGPGLYKEGILIEKSISIVGNDFASVTDPKNIERIKLLKKKKEAKDLQGKTIQNGIENSC